MDDTPLLIRDEYEQLYNLVSEESTEFAYSGFAIIGHLGMGQLQLHWVSAEVCLW